jgi:hypothetical protein
LVEINKVDSRRRKDSERLSRSSGKNSRRTSRKAESLGSMARVIL